MLLELPADVLRTILLQYAPKHSRFPLMLVCKRISALIYSERRTTSKGCLCFDGPGWMPQAIRNIENGRLSAPPMRKIRFITPGFALLYAAKENHPDLMRWYYQVLRVPPERYAMVGMAIEHNNLECVKAGIAAIRAGGWRPDYKDLLARALATSHLTIAEFLVTEDGANADALFVLKNSRLIRTAVVFGDPATLEWVAGKIGHAEVVRRVSKELLFLVSSGEARQDVYAWLVRNCLLFNKELLADAAHSAATHHNARALEVIAAAIRKK
jgi:hypothetical protein